MFKLLNLTRLLVFLNLITFSVILMASVLLYNTDTVMFKVVDYIDAKTSNVIKLGEKRNKLMNFIHEINIFSSKALNIGVIPEVPILDFELTKNNIDYIDGVITRSIDQSSNVYSLGPFISIYDNDFTEDTETTILFNGRMFDAKIKLHGVSDRNWIHPKKSFSVKTSKEDFINNTRRFKLIIFEEQFLQTILASRLASLMNYINVDTEIIKLRFNGVDQGYYLLEEALSKELLEKNNLPTVDVIKGLDEWTHQYKSGHLTLFSHEISNQNFKNFSGRDVGQLLLFQELMEGQTYEEIKDLVDIDKFALHEAMRILFATDQAITGDNIKWLFDTSNGKFFPYFRMEGYLNELPTSEKSYTFDRDLNEWFWFDYDIKIFPILNRNNDFRELRNKYLHKILLQRSSIESFYLTLFERYGQIPKLDNTNNFPARWYSKKMKDSINALSNNFDLIEKYLSYSKVYTTINQTNDNEFILKIIPDSNSTIHIDELIINGVEMNEIYEITELSQNIKTSEFSNLKNYFKDKQFSLSLDDSLEVEKNIYEYHIRSIKNIDIKDYKISFNNSITGKSVLERETYRAFIKSPKKLNLNNKNSNFSPDNYLTKYPFLVIQDKTITFNEGAYYIYEDLEIPEEYDVRILPGCKLFLSNNISILIHGNLKILGTKDQNVKITNINIDEPFGVFAAVGNGKTTVDISGLDLSQGNEDIISGLFLSGALSLYHHEKVNLVDSKIYNNFADDGLNIKNSDIFIQNNSFSNNFADQVDLDFVNGEVLNNTFISEPLKKSASENGDGLDISGSNVIIKNNISSNFLDKGFSIGEKTNAILLNNLFNNNRSAISVKDQSKVYIFENQYNENEVDIEMYQKKQIFNEPSVFNLNNSKLNFKIKKSPKSTFYSNQNEFDTKIIDTIKDSLDFEKMLSLFNEFDWTDGK